MPEGYPPRRQWPGTDPRTGWPLTPQYPCPKATRPEELLELVGPVLCYLRLTEEPMQCVETPPRCPFYGHFPNMSGPGPQK